MERENLFEDFLRVRKRFEEGIEKYDYLVQQIVRYYRSAFRSYPYVRDFYLKLMKELLTENDTEKAIQNIAGTMGIRLSVKRPDESEKPTKKKADRHVKSQVFLDMAKKNVIECPGCGGRLHKTTISMDHDIPLREGGMGTPQNLRPMHPYCNTLRKH